MRVGQVVLVTGASRYLGGRFAELMRVSKMTVYRLVHSGQMPAVQFGRSYRVPESAVEQYVRSASVEGESSAG